MTQPKRIRPALALAVAALALVTPTRRAIAAAAPVTDWTGPASGLWADPLNWSNGLPTAAATATITFPYNSSALIPIDLGGVQRTAGTLDLLSPYLRLTNGSLVVDTVHAQYGYDSSSPPNTLAIPVTSGGPTLRLYGAVRSILHVDAPITGAGFAVQPVYARLAAANTYNGPTLVTSNGPVTFADQGSARDAASFQIGGRLVLDNQTTPLDDRLNDAAPLRFGGGELLLLGNTTVPTAERVGLLDFAGTGAINFGNPPNVQPITLRAAGIRHDAGATASVALNPAAGHRVLLDQVPQLTGGGPGAPPTARGVLPWVIDANTRLPMTYDPGDPAAPAAAPGLRPLDVATDFADAFLDPTPAGVAHNVRLTADQTRTGDAAVNVLALTGATLTLDHANLTVRSGAMSLDGGTITGDGSLQFPGDATISGYGHLDVPVKARSLTLAANDNWFLSKPNDLPGGINVGYNVTVTHPQALGSGRVHVDDGSRVSLNVGDATFANDFAFGDVAPTPPAAPGTYYELVRVVTARGSTVTFTGDFSGGVMTLSLAGGTTYRLNGNGAFDSLYLNANAWLELNGTLGPLPRTSPAFVEFHGKLAGVGTLLGSADGTIAPGPVGEPGRLTVRQVNRASLDIDLAGPSAGTQYDQLVVLGVMLTLVDLNLNLAPGFDPAPGDQFLIVDNRYPGPPFATFDGLPEGAIFAADGAQFRISYTAGDGNDIALTVVPEPAAAAFLAAAAPLLLRRHRRR